MQNQKNISLSKINDKKNEIKEYFSQLSDEFPNQENLIATKFREIGFLFLDNKAKHTVLVVSSTWTYLPLYLLMFAQKVDIYIPHHDAFLTRFKTALASFSLRISFLTKNEFEKKLRNNQAEYSSIYIHNHEELKLFGKKMFENLPKLLCSGGQLIVCGDYLYYYRGIKTEVSILKSINSRIFCILQTLKNIKELKVKASEHTASYSVYPSILSPELVLAAKSEAPKLVAQKGLIYHFFQQLKMTHILYGGYLKSLSTTNTLLDELISQSFHDIGISANYSVKSFQLRENDVVLLILSLSSGKDVILRIPLNQSGKDRLNSAWNTIENISHSNRDLLQILPKQLYRNNINGLPLFIEECKSGNDYKSYLNLESSAKYVLPHILETLIKINKTKYHPILMTEDIWQVKIGNKINSIQLKFPKLQKSLSDLSEKYMLRMVNETINVVFSHGDFNAGNIIVDSTSMNVTGVIDWDSSQIDALPLLDLIHLLISCHRYQTELCIGDAVISTLNGSLLKQQEQQVLNSYMDSFDITNKIFDSLVFAYWVNNIYLHVNKEDFLISHGWINDNIFHPVKMMEKM